MAMQSQPAMDIGRESEIGVMAKEYNNLASAIVRQAVDDWRILIKREVRGKEVTPKAYQEIRVFLRGEWGQLLAGGVDTKKILARLEWERENALAGRV